MAAKTNNPRPDKGVRAIAEHAHEVSVMLRAKLLAQLTPEQRDILFTVETLTDLNDAVFAAEPEHIVNKPPRNLSHAHILAEAQHGEWLLTGCDWYKLHKEDLANTTARITRAGLEDK